MSTSRLAYLAKIFTPALLVVALGLSLAACEDGSYLDMDTKQLKSDKVGRIEAQGTDLRVYEFTPQTDAGMQCVFVAGKQKGGLYCWEKRT